MVITTTKKRVGGSTDIPIFLQKAYHMIDTCDPKICSWSDDGLTFIVKNTTLFETTIIPQFFKHNKFSSFVRQLNFYGFRKVKFSNSLRINHKLEKETAKWWRFKHDKFRRGRKDLLIHIKRTPSLSSMVPPPPSAAALKAAAAARAPTSSSTVATQNLPKINNSSTKSPPEDVSNLKAEMKEMKLRVESMTKNIDELTDLVKKVSVKEEKEGGAVATVEPEVGNKRKKVDTTTASAIKQEDEEDDVIMNDLPIMPDWNPSSSDIAGVDSLLLSAGEPLPDLPTSATNSKAPSPTPSDDTFVDELFEAFANEDDVIPGLEDLEAEATSNEEKQPTNPNKPDPQLMKRIEDSLSTIPRDMHEMVANRLIDAISDAKPVVDSAASLFDSTSSSCSATIEATATKMDRSISVDEAETKPAAVTKAPTIPLPLAVATLKTILSEYGVSVECSRRTSCKEEETARSTSRFTKSLPVVPMHA